MQCGLADFEEFVGQKLELKKILVNQMNSRKVIHRGPVAGRGADRYALRIHMNYVRPGEQIFTYL